MSNIVITGIGLITPAGTGTRCVLEAMRAGQHFFSHGKPDARLPWLMAEAPWSEVTWPEGDQWRNNKKFANLASQAAVTVANLALEQSGIADEHEARRCGTVIAMGGGGSDELASLMPKLAVMAETDPRPLATLLYDEVPDFSYIRGIPSQIGQFTSMASGYRGSNVVVSGAGGLAALATAMRLIQSGELDRVMIVGVSPPVSLGALAAIERDEPLATGLAPAIGPFGADRHGTLVGQGAVAIVIELEASALERGACVLADVLACEAISAPDHGTAQREATRMVLAQAQRQPAVWWASAAGSPTLDLQEHDAVTTQTRAVTTSSKGTIGNAFECAGLIDVALAVDALTTGIAPPIGLMDQCDDAFAHTDLVEGDERLMPQASCSLITTMGFGSNTTAGATLIGRNQS